MKLVSHLSVSLQLLILKVNTIPLGGDQGQYHLERPEAFCRLSEPQTLN